MTRIFTVLVGIFTAASTGCCLCAHPYDFCYPTCDGSCGGTCCESDGRVLSAFNPRPAPFPQHIDEGGAEAELVPAPDSKAGEPEFGPEPFQLPLPMPERDGNTAHERNSWRRGDGRY